MVCGYGDEGKVVEKERQTQSTGFRGDTATRAAVVSVRGVVGQLPGVGGTFLCTPEVSCGEADHSQDTGGSIVMPLMTLSVQHGQTLDEARSHLATAVHEITNRFGTLVKRVAWSPDRSQVRLEGSGAWIELRVDGQAVHVSADLPVFGRLLGGSVTTRLKEIIQRTFQQKLPGDNEKA
jgi:hypothetical protein